MTWEGVIDGHGRIRAVRMTDRNERVVRWDGLGGPTTEWGQANARLIIAAPEMLDALERIIALVRNGWKIYKGQEEYIAAIDAIRKARGEK